MDKVIATFLAVGSAGLLVGCAVEDDYYSSSGNRPVYYSDGYNDDVDFYYVSSRPYSRSYGPLYLRDGRYYYSHGGSYVVYDRPTHYRNTNYHVVNRDVNVRNVHYNNEQVVRHYNTTRNYDHYDRPAHGQYHTAYRTTTNHPAQVHVASGNKHHSEVQVVEKKKKKKHYE
jgi:hypothetical protein